MKHSAPLIERFVVGQQNGFALEIGHSQVLLDPLQIRKKGWDNSPVPIKKLSHDCIVYRRDLSANSRVV
jgi:hypothetical protein